MDLTSSAPQYRVDKFIVPPAAMPAFMARLEYTRRALGELPGCRQNLVLTQTAGPGEFNVVTIVEWASQQALAEARAAMQARYAQEGFDTAAFLAQLGVRADLAVYAPAAAAPSALEGR
jgi:heme-degrading monooxygenase HmoA